MILALATTAEELKNIAVNRGLEIFKCKEQVVKGQDYIFMARPSNDLIAVICKCKRFGMRKGSYTII